MLDYPRCLLTMAEDRDIAEDRVAENAHVVELLINPGTQRSYKRRHVSLTALENLEVKRLTRASQLLINCVNGYGQENCKENN